MEISNPHTSSPKVKKFDKQFYMLYASKNNKEVAAEWVSKIIQTIKAQRLVADEPSDNEDDDEHKNTHESICEGMVRKLKDTDKINWSNRYCCLDKTQFTTYYKAKDPSPIASLNLTMVALSGCLTLNNNKCFYIKGKGANTFNDIYEAPTSAERNNWVRAFGTLGVTIVNPQKADAVSHKDRISRKSKPATHHKQFSAGEEENMANPLVCNLESESEDEEDEEDEQDEDEEDEKEEAEKDTTNLASPSAQQLKNVRRSILMASQDASIPFAGLDLGELEDDESEDEGEL